MEKEVYVCPVIVDYDNLFATDPDAHVLVCDNTISKNQMQEQLQQLCLDGSKDLNFVASCECGKLSGNFWDQAEGQVCKYCHTRCETNFAKRLKFRAWLEIPPYAPPVVHPKIYAILNKWMGKIAKVPVMEYLLNPEIELPPILAGKVGQGARYFYENFDNIINFFLTQFQPLQLSAARKRAKGIPELISIYRDKIFVRHIPILNQELHLMTRSGSMMYSDDCLQSILKARIELGMLQQIYNSGVVSNHHIDARLFDFLMAIVEYDDLIDSVKMLGKTGQIRKLILGARFHCSIRAVISPLFGPHKIDEIHLPWKGAVILYKLEILNILVKRMGYSVPEALKIYEHAENSYSKIVDDIFKLLIKECQELTGLPGLPMTFGRNPRAKARGHMFSNDRCAYTP